MKIVICDDREFELEILKKLCEEYVSEHIPETEIVCTTNPGRIAAEDPDILILDIEMPEKSGIEIKNELTDGDRPSQGIEAKKAWGDHAFKVPY